MRKREKRKEEKEKRKEKEKEKENERRRDGLKFNRHNKDAIRRREKMKTCNLKGYN